MKISLNQWNNMLSKQTKTALFNKENCYTCTACGHITKTIDIDPGTTPMFFQCEICDSRAVSSMYRDIAPDKEPTQEWYRPALKKVKKMQPAFVDHIMMGGLLSRKIIKK